MKKTSVFIAAAALAFVVAAVFAQANIFFGKASPGPEPVKFLHENLHPGLCPHGQLAFAPDGSGVFWSAIALEGRKQTLHWSAFDGKAFSPPVAAPFAAEGGNGGPAFSSDGRRLFFNVEIPGPDDASPKTMAIAYVERSGSGWTKPVQIESTIDTLMTRGQVSVARSGNIYFSGRILTERAPTIFVSRFVDGKYAPPEKLAGPIADVPFVVDPWVDPDERFLLVSSPPAEGPPMLTDIGICSRQSDEAWSKPVRLSGPVNTTAFERFASLSSDGKYLFFIRAFGQQFVRDQAHFFWVETKAIPELQPAWAPEKASPVLQGPYLGQDPPGMTPMVFAPDFVSTSLHEFACSFAPNGKEFYFSRRDFAKNDLGVFVTWLADSGWTAPKEFIEMACFEPLITPDGNRLYFSEMGVKDNKPQMVIWYLERKGPDWGKPIPAGDVLTPDKAMYISVATSGNIYTTDITGGLGNAKLALSQFKDNQNGELKAIGPFFTDGKSDMYPFISPDESYLLFCHPATQLNGANGIHVAFRKNDGMWSEARYVDLGMQAGMPYVSPDGKYLFFTGGERRKGDIFWVSAKVIETLRPQELKTDFHSIQTRLQ